jgi:hypothetical protein
LTVPLRLDLPVEFVNLPGAGLGGIPLNFCGVAIEIIRNYPGEIIFILRIAKKNM